MAIAPQKYLSRGHVLRLACGWLIGLVLAGSAGLLWWQIVRATTNIHAGDTERYAWNDLMGWIDFYGTDTITVSSPSLTGYASSSAGDVSLDCHTTRGGDICATSTYQVTNDGLGSLSGYGWNDNYGWISFDCNNEGSCSTSSYRAYINPSNGTFSNYAWNDIAGWISLNCQDPGICGSYNYKVVTDWVATSTTGILDSATYDTGVSGGAQINSLIWYGSLPADTDVRFQLATASATSGPWDYIGSDGTAYSYYTAAAGTPIKLDCTLHNNQRYFRYRVTLVSDQAQHQTPRVDDVVVNWSP